MITNAILLDDYDAAALLCLPRCRLLRLVKVGRVPRVILPDGEIRFRREDLVTWVASYLQPAKSPEEVPND